MKTEEYFIKSEPYYEPIGDETAKDYLPYMYWPASFTVIDDVMKLPLKVTDIYRRLTT